jgi:hypothetical protein
MNICPQCNTPYEPGAVFCDNCGASLAAPAPAQPQPAYQPPPAAQPQPNYAPPPVQPAYQPPPAYPPTQAAGSANCTQCGQPLTPGAAFCDNCGAPVGAAPAYPPAQPGGYPPPVQQTPASPPPVQPAYQQPPQGPVYGGPSPRLIVQTTNAQIMLPPGKTEYIVGREDPVSNIFPDVDMTPHGGDDGGVSRRHARLFQQNGQWFVEDFQSTNFTHVNNQRVQPGTPMPVPNGAELRFGRVKLTFYAQ